MIHNYTEDQNIQVIIFLLKAHGISKIIASPGATNLSFVASLQSDPYFDIYSAVDERSAAYMACGIAAECNEPVVLSCTGATASRNYMPGLTEAFYRKLPILAITSSQPISKIGHLSAQLLDRSVLPNDVAKLSVELPIVRDKDDLWDCEIKVNKAILELSRHGGGPVHINLPTIYSRKFDVKELPEYRVINRITSHDRFPELPKGRIAIFVGSHHTFTEQQNCAIEDFCCVNDAVVFCDHTSGYYGKYRVGYSLVAYQKNFKHHTKNPDLIIHIGEVSGDYYSLGMVSREVWRVNADGEIRDTYRKLSYVFEMEEDDFFKAYSASSNHILNDYYTECSTILAQVRCKIPEVPFSNIWVAQHLHDKLPQNSVLHLAILNSLRSWNFFDIPNDITTFSNVGGFGIDGCVSSLVGASLVNTDKLYFAVVGDLAFFYDMNIVGNRHLGNNVRILLINNGKGTEFRNHNHAAAYFGDDADNYIAAAGHFGNKSPLLIKHYAEDLGFSYISANDKQSFFEVIPKFLDLQTSNSPIIFEVFTDSEDESDALKILGELESNVKISARSFAKQVIGDMGINAIKKIIK